MATNEKQKDDVSFKIVEQLGVIKAYQSGWTKELNLVSWNGGNPKYDLRDWSSDHQHMSRGITFHKDEAEELRNLLNQEEF